MNKKSKPPPKKKLEKENYREFRGAAATDECNLPTIWLNGIRFDSIYNNQLEQIDWRTDGQMVAHLQESPCWWWYLMDVPYSRYVDKYCRHSQSLFIGGIRQHVTIICVRPSDSVIASRIIEVYQSSSAGDTWRHGCKKIQLRSATFLVIFILMEYFFIQLYREWMCKIYMYSKTRRYKKWLPTLRVK